MPRRLTAPGVTHESYIIHICFVEKKAQGVSVPFFPLLQMLKQQPAAGIIFVAQALENVGKAAVKEILIDRDENIPPACQQFTKVGVSPFRPVLRQMVTMHPKHQGKGAVSFRMPYFCIKGQGIPVKTKVPGAELSRQPFPRREKG